MVAMIHSSLTFYVLNQDYLISLKSTILQATITVSAMISIENSDEYEHRVPQVKKVWLHNLLHLFQNTG